MEKEQPGKSSGTSGGAAQKNWFRVPGKNLWHAEAHREYGVLWSRCGIRLVSGSAETTDALPEGGTVCPNCTARRKG